LVDSGSGGFCQLTAELLKPDRVSMLGVILLLPLTIRRVASGTLRPWSLTGATVVGALALVGTTKFPNTTPAAWGQTAVWMLHLFGGAIWIGGLATASPWAHLAVVPGPRNEAGSAAKEPVLGQDGAVSRIFMG
jgi:putative copper export protein